MFLGDLMAPDRVKFHYRKAMLILHPDKNVNGTVEQRFISEKVCPTLLTLPPIKLIQMRGVPGPAPRRVGVCGLRRSEVLTLVLRGCGALFSPLCQVFTCVNEAYTTFAAQELK